MNDTFAAGLRQHLAETADERPAHSQLSRVIDGVAATPQRRPLLTGLRWDLPHVGLLAPSAVRYGLLVTAVVLAAVAGASTGGGAMDGHRPPPPATPTSAPEATASPTSGPTVVPPKPDPDCIQFDAPGTYSAPVGSLTLTVAMPGSVAEPWIGERARFDVSRAACPDWYRWGWIHAGVVTWVDTTACTGDPVEVRTTAEAVAAVSGAAGIDIAEQRDVTLDGYSGTWFDIRVHDKAGDPCSYLSQLPLVDGLHGIDSGLGLRLYLLDVDGTTLALGLSGYSDQDPALRAQVDGIIASLRIDP